MVQNNQESRVSIKQNRQKKSPKMTRSYHDRRMIFILPGWVCCQVGHDGKGIGAGWHLDKVHVRRLLDDDDDEDAKKRRKSSRGRKQSSSSSSAVDADAEKRKSETIVFPCGRWLAKDEDDGALERTLEADQRLLQTVRGDRSF